MTTWTVAELIRVFRLTIPAMPASVVSDAELESDIVIYREYVSQKRFGKLFPKALSYFIAHMRTLNAMIEAASADGGMGAGDPVFTAGALTSEKEGDLARNYSNSSASSTNNSDSDDLLKKTLYGKMFLQLRDMVIVSVTMRESAGGCYGAGHRFRI